MGKPKGRNARERISQDVRSSPVQFATGRMEPRGRERHRWVKPRGREERERISQSAVADDSTLHVATARHMSERVFYPDTDDVSSTSKVVALSIARNRTREMIFPIHAFLSRHSFSVDGS